MRLTDSVFCGLICDASPILESSAGRPSDGTFSVIHNIVARIHSLSTEKSTFALVVYFRFATIGKSLHPSSVAESSETQESPFTTQYQP
jgi:hypothetical protein